jgi:hypothetical protein
LAEKEIKKLIVAISMIYFWGLCHKPGSAKANGKEPKSCLGRVFNFKLGPFVMYVIAWHIQKHALA